VNAGPLLELRDIHDAPAVGSGTDLSKIIPRLDLEQYALCVNAFDTRKRAYPTTDRRGRQMPDID
jgi:hypothetical protein